MDDPAEAENLLSQPKRVALLVSLVLAGPAFQRRDAIAALLWPEADQERARNSLRQGLHRLRQALGAEAILNRGSEEIALAPGLIQCDAVAFREAVAAGRPEEALARYTGELLPAFHAPGAPEFMDWLEGERAALRSDALRTARTLADRAERAGRLPEAARWAARGLALSPADEPLAERLVLALERAGDRAGALAAFEEFAARLRRELGLEPGPGLAALAAGIRARAPTLPPVAEPAPPAPAPRSEAPPMVAAPRRPRWPLVALLAAVLGVIVVLRFPARATPPASAGAGRTLVILPFRVGGADPALGYLREGMVDLLAARLTGEAGELRAVDPRTTLQAWHRATGDSTELTPAAAMQLAGSLGAGRVLLGGVVGRAERLALQVAAYDVASGATRARGTAEGPTDSLPELVDQLAAQLLAGEAPGSAAVTPGFAGTPLPAVRAWLEGVQAYRAGRYAEAFARYQAAVQADSTFGPAALGLAAAGSWYPSAEGERQRGLRLAWAARARLTPKDRAFLTALAGPAFPRVTDWRDRLGAWERALAVDSGRAEAWYEYGDVLMHRGPLLDLHNSAALAERAFSRAVLLDSSFAAPVGHLFDLGAGLDDRRLAEAAAALFLARDSASDIADYVRWRRAVITGDDALRRALRRRLPLMSVASLSRIVGASQLDGLPLDDAVAAAGLLTSRPLAAWEQDETNGYLMELALNRGHPAEAAARADLLASRAGGEDAALAAHILNALYADGDSAAAARTAARFATYLQAPPPPTGEARALHLWKACAAAEWRAWHGDTAGVAAVVVALRRIEGAQLPWWAPANQRLCAARIDAIAATVLERPAAAALVARLDSLTRPVPDLDVRDPTTLTVALLWERLRDPPRALDAVRRRQYHHRTGLPYLARRLREEGALALATGDTAAARGAWQHFLVLYANPAPERTALRDQVRAHLAALPSR